MTAKRAFDVFVAAGALVLLAPLLAIVCVAIKLDSAGPALYRQERVGQGGRSFRILKFRTMHVDPNGDGFQLTVAGSSRITRLGRLLRALKVDELPQLLNVLGGQMSLVGPRPEVPRYVALYPPEMRETILSVRPGITDPASIAFRDESALLARAKDPQKLYLDEILPKKLAMSAAYISRSNLLADMRILGATLVAAFRPATVRGDAVDSPGDAMS